MRIFHVATRADWESAVVAGRYATSTRGRTLAEEGFIHASRGDQWQGVRARYYADVAEPLVLLVIDTDLLTAPVVDEEVPGGESFPHVYGPIEASAVVQTIPLEPLGAATGADDAVAVAAPAAPTEPTLPTEPTQSFSRIYLTEVFRNTLIASFVLACVVTGTLTGLAIQEEWGPISGALIGLVAGIVLVRRPWRPRAG